jgi:CubicO group peptidase (beta-lactamase class C family)
MFSSVMFFPTLLVLAGFLSLSHGATNCPLMGPIFPKPQNLSMSASMQAAVQNLTATFAQRDADNSTGALTNSYSIQVFSASDPTPLFQHYHTAPNLPSFNSTGVTQVDADTIFRIGSLTKIFTIYTFLAEAGDVHFNSPITDFVPELAALAKNTSGNAITRVAWEDITIGELASHMAGIAADSKKKKRCKIFCSDTSVDSLMGELTQTLGNETVAIGFPPLSATEIPTCGVYPLCNRTGDILLVFCSRFQFITDRGLKC